MTLPSTTLLYAKCSIKQFLPKPMTTEAKNRIYRTNNRKKRERWGISNATPKHPSSGARSIEAGI